MSDNVCMGDVMAITQNDIDNWFSYHVPLPGQPERYQALRTKAGELARLIVDLTPAGVDQAVAIRKLRECIMTANASIACGE